MLVTSNVINDPRVQKEAQIAADNQLRVTIIGREDRQNDQTPLQQRNYTVELLPIKRSDQDSLIIRLFERAKFMRALYDRCVKLRPNIIHANDFDTLPAAYYAARKLRCAIVYDSHEIWTEQGRIGKHNALKRMVQAYERHLMERVSANIAVSNASAGKFVEMYNIPRPHVVTNCPYSFRERDEVKKSRGFEVIYHGIFAEDRGYEDYCLAAKRLTDDDVTLVLRGFGPLEERLRAIVGQEGLSNRVRFDAPVAVWDMTAAAARSHVGVVLMRPVNISFKYTVTNKVFEYVQAGLPVIMSDTVENRYLSEHYGIGLVLQEITPDTVAEAITTLRRDTGLYAKLRSNVLTAAKRFSWEQEGQKLIDIYRQVSRRESPLFGKAD